MKYKIQNTLHMKTIITISIIFLLVLKSYSQITITSSDMPNVNDTFRLSTALTAGLDPALTGTNYTWDFSGLTPTSQRVDEYVSVTATSLLYYPTFILSASIAKAQPSFDLIPGFEFTDVYNFYKESSSQFSGVGIAGKIAGLPLPTKYDDPDILYNFPLNYGDIDSCESSFDISIPLMGSLVEERDRKNIVDGWGTLITPYGSFQVLRIKSELMKKDSLHVDSLGISIPAITTNTIEYKWIGNSHGIPLLQINTNLGIATSIEYLDSIRNVISWSVEEISQQDLSLNIYPNPAIDEFQINYNLSKRSEIEISICSVNGQKSDLLINDVRSKGVHSEIFSLADFNLEPGVYILQFKTNYCINTKSLIIH